MRKIIYFFSIFVLLMSFGCENNDDQILIVDDIPIVDQKKEYKILSLGDSYTIGESVCETCRFPEQLKDSLSITFKKDTTFSLQVIAKTGWTTTNLINTIEQKNITDDFDLVTLLIGVNNQFQNKNFSIYEQEFPELIATSIRAANNTKANVIVVSIPDYAFTPFGRGSASISTGIDKYNEFAKSYCDQNGITFVNITDITRQGLTNPNLVASDGLHPSELAYTKFVERILPLAIEKLKD
ncbi:SGNH/GDSL hydrolase family protein [Polaribacter sp. Hel_I_88]|uniref:SGNH/GDSL hydrolase family protein n=1 Tax=Polaribacter sp. Hel_I_88 TaxID=1250006 RepID=UPI000560B1BF|nr:SGNH/GDSL hydrolase family protein [Polaribacter sp. Hel_I_88]